MARMQEASARLVEVQQQEETLKQREESLKQELVQCAAAQQAAEEEGEAAAKVSDSLTVTRRQRLDREALSHSGMNASRA